MTIATIVIFRISTSPTETGRFSETSEVAVFPSGPNQRRAIACSRKATANVAISITAGDCARSGRKTTRSMASESSTTTTTQSAIPTAAGQPRSDGEREREAPRP